MKKKELSGTKRMICFLLICLTVIGGMPMTASAATSKNYKLTGNQANDIIAVAEAQKGLDRYDFGWDCDYCCMFVNWAGNKAGAKFPKPYDAANPRALAAWFCNNKAGTFYYFRDANYTSLVEDEYMSSAAKKLCIKADRKKFTPQKGDILIFLWEDDIPKYNWSHAGIIKNFNKTTNTIQTIEGNTTSDLVVASRSRKFDSEVVGIIRPNYSTSKSSKSAPLGGSTPCPKTNVPYNFVNQESLKYLNVSYSAAGNGVNVNIFQRDFTLGESFKLYMSKSGYYTIEPGCASGYRVNVHTGGSVKANDNIDLWKKSGNPSQGFYLDPVPGGYVIRSADNPNLVMAETGTKNESNVKLVKYKEGSKAQIWDLRAE